jgi:hypothetical protein
LNTKYLLQATNNDSAFTDNWVWLKKGATRLKGIFLQLCDGGMLAAEGAVVVLGEVEPLPVHCQGIKSE